MRRVGALAVCAMVVVACAPEAGTGQRPDDGIAAPTATSTGETSVATPTGAPPPTGPAGEAGQENGPTSPATEQPAGDGTEQAPPRTATDDLGSVGANGRAYLRPDHDVLVVEIDVQDGVTPDSRAVEHLRSTIQRYADKAEVRLAGGNGFSSERTEWTRDDLRAAAQRNRGHYSDGRTAVLYVLYVRGAFHSGGERTEAVGVTYNASEIAMFPERWSGIGSLVGTGREIERAVLVHEFGHALGLVNLTYQSDIDHEDPDHPGHSSNRGSVMYWAVETTLIGQVFDGPPPDEFDEADRADIEGLRTGRY